MKYPQKWRKIFIMQRRVLPLFRKVARHGTVHARTEQFGFNEYMKTHYSNKERK
jgi:hypothetical protein